MKALRPCHATRFTTRHKRFTLDEGGFTLVELMVALALAAIMSVVIMMISTQAREVYEATTRKVEVYNKFRAALFSIDRDFSRWISTANLEFFVDGKGSGARRNENWEPGEEIKDVDDLSGPGVVDGGIFGQFDEFATITEVSYLGEDVEGQWKRHDAFQAYFRTMTFIDGETREAVVEYKLLDPGNLDRHGNPLPPTKVPRARLKDLGLFKIVRYHNFKLEELEKLNTNPEIIRRYVEVCTNITDFRIEYTTGNRIVQTVEPAFRTPAEDYATPSELATRPEELKGELGDFTAYQKSFGYGTFKLQKRFELAQGFRGRQGDRLNPGGSDHRPTRLGWQRNPKIQFAELVSGDPIYIFNQSNRGGGGGGAQGVAGNVGALLQFPTGMYTVHTNLSGQLELRETIDSTTWARDPTAIHYKAAFIPEAVRVMIRVVDEARGEEARSLQKVIWMRQRSR